MSAMEQELLIAAAKSISLPFINYTRGVGGHRAGLVIQKADNSIHVWNPILDLGERARLIRAHEMTICYRTCAGSVPLKGQHFRFRWSKGNELQEGRAIVQAAGETWRRKQRI